MGSCIEKMVGKAMAMLEEELDVVTLALAALTEEELVVLVLVLATVTATAPGEEV